MKKSSIFFLALLGLLVCGLGIYFTPDKYIDSKTMNERVAATVSAAQLGKSLNDERKKFVPTIIAQEIREKESDIKQKESLAAVNFAEARVRDASAWGIFIRNATNVVLCIIVALFSVIFVSIVVKRRQLDK